MKIQTQSFEFCKGICGAATILLVLAFGTAEMPAQTAVQLSLQSGQDVGSLVNAAISNLQNKGGGSIQLPAGSLIQSTPIRVSGGGIHIIGASTGTTLNFNPDRYLLVDSNDSGQGWQASGARIWPLNSFGEDHPEPMEGAGYIAVNTANGSASISKSIPPTDFSRFPKIGTWISVNLSGEQTPIQFYASDGSKTAFWNLTLASIYATWKFSGIDRNRPTGTDGGMPNMGRITTIGFRNLVPHAKYFFDAISLYAPSGPSFAFSSCEGCSLENVRIQWEPAADSDAVILSDQQSEQLTLRNVHTTGGADGISFVGPSAGGVCESCSAEYASQNGISLRGNTTGNRLSNPIVSRNVVGIYIGTQATKNAITTARCVRNDGAGIFIDGNDNQVADADIDTWMTFGLVIHGGSRNIVTGVTAKSSVGESAVQLIGGAADNQISKINIEQSGGSGLDLGGGVKPQIHNRASDITVHNSGSSSWHGGPKASSEGRGLCLCNANDNVITGLRIYDTAQKSTVPGAEGIILNNGSSGNVLENVTISNSRHEGITVWDAPNNSFKNVRLVGNGMHEGSGAGIRIDSASKNTTLQDVCFWMNGGGGIKNLSTSSHIQNVKQVSNLDPERECR